MSNRVTGEITAIHAELCRADKPHNGIGDISVAGESFDFDVRTAERLAACWNACEGLSDEVLEDGIFSIVALRKYLQGIHEGGHESLAETAFRKLTGRELFES